MEKVKKRQTGQMDMLNGPLMSRIILFALPLAASSILQQLFNAADVAVVGRFAGNQALAAVGGNSSVINLLVNLFVGFSVGANVVIARYIGEGKTEKIQSTVHTVISMALICGLILSVLGNVVAGPLLKLMNTPDEVLPLATVYLKIYFGGMPFFMLYNFGSAILRSIGDTQKPLYCLILSGFVNVGLNLLLVIVFKLSVVGVAIATVTANGVSAGLILLFLCRSKESIRLDLRRLKLCLEEAVKIVKIGAPAGLQGMVFSFSNVCIQSAINGFGTDAIAGSAAALNYEFFTFFVTSAFTQAAVTFTSQNYGARQYERCKSVWRISALLGVCGTGILCAVFVLGREFFLGLFAADAVAVSYGAVRMLHIQVFSFMPPLYEVTGGVLRGMGYSMTPAILTMFGSCAVRVIWIYTVFAWKPTLRMLFWVYPFSWVITIALVVGAYVVISRKTLVCEK
ncbi:MATE efflux family protein [Lachnospiraceae bacterium MD308]|jgi:putative efflux protein, MATE family|nr:MATE efflux family protein [Lachnospiraceae bacterium MD308]MCI8504197.1 MATE family efflux transporter [Dorea sp.]